MKKDKSQSTGWVALKSGAMRNGDWYASLYVTGWYFVCSSSSGAYHPSSKMPILHKTFGPFATFEDGVKEWEGSK